MRNPELMLDVLREMSRVPSGQTQSGFMAINPTEESQSRCHHFDLLVDVGHAEWVSNDKTIARITNEGYDFLNAVDQGDRYFEKFIELFNKGVRFVDAASKIVDMVGKAAFTGG